MTRRTPTYVGLRCPADLRHGPLIESHSRLRCIHQEHDGRPKTHPLGQAPATRATFTLDEAEAAAVELRR